MARCDCRALTKGFHGTLPELVEALTEALSEYGTVRWTSHTDEESETQTMVLELVTGGWSEHEDLVARVLRGPLLVMHWHSSFRGGLHIFEFPAFMVEDAEAKQWLAPLTDADETRPKARWVDVVLPSGTESFAFADGIEVTYDDEHAPGLVIRARSGGVP